MTYHGLDNRKWDLIDYSVTFSRAPELGIGERHCPPKGLTAVLLPFRGLFTQLLPGESQPAGVFMTPQVAALSCD